MACYPQIIPLPIFFKFIINVSVSYLYQGILAETSAELVAEDVGGRRVNGWHGFKFSFFAGIPSAKLLPG